MAASIGRFRTRAQREADEDATQLRLILQRRPDLLTPRLTTLAVVRLDQRDPATNTWQFIMISAEDNAKVVEWLVENSKRPMVAVRLWSKLFVHARRDTGEIGPTREELAELVGILPRHVSEVMTELESIGVISRRRERVAGMRGPGAVRYFLSPLVATHLAGAARDKAQAKAPKLRLV